MKRILILTLCLLPMPAALHAVDVQGSERPSILFILADDLGYGDLSCYNPNSAVKTPNIDRLAAAGVRYTDFYAQNCCTPTRAALMTGCYAKRVGLDIGSWSGTLGFGDPRGLNPEEITIAELFKQRGYVTGMIGKWHLGDQPEFWPRKHGFTRGRWSWRPGA
jgi:arylsulfatase A-like enzyme